MLFLHKMRILCDSEGVCISLHLYLQWHFLLPFCRLWIQEEIAFGKERFDFFSQVDEESARVLKDIGNKQFKSNSFDEAIRRYTEALNCCPQGTEASKAGKDGRW